MRTETLDELDELDWGNDSLVSSFKEIKLEESLRDKEWKETTTRSQATNQDEKKSIPLVSPTLKREDATLSEFGEREVPRWVQDVNRNISQHDRGTQVDLMMTASGECPKNWWKACTDIYCRKHLADKRKGKWFPGADPYKMYRALNYQQMLAKECDQQDWELCFVEDCEKHWRERVAMGLDDSKN